MRKPTHHPLWGTGRTRIIGVRAPVFVSSDQKTRRDSTSAHVTIPIAAFTAAVASLFLGLLPSFC